MTKNHETLGQDKQKQKQPTNISHINFQILPMHLVLNSERKKYIFP